MRVPRFGLLALVLAVSPLRLAAAADGGSGGTNEVGLKFLEENKKRPGVIVLPSGAQFKILKEGDGTTHPKADTVIKAHFIGTTPSLTPDAPDLDSGKWNYYDNTFSEGTPSAFAPNEVIEGFEELFQLMVEGDIWEGYIPAELAYGKKGKKFKGKKLVKAGDVLIVRVALIMLKGVGVPAETGCDVQTSERCSEQQKAYIEKQRAKKPSERREELTRLEGMTAMEMDLEKKLWVLGRMWILRRLTEQVIEGPGTWSEANLKRAMEL